MQQLEALRQQLKIPGMAVAVQRGDTVLLAEGLGYADLDRHIKVTPQTAFGVASIGKTFTSTLVMQLVEAGKLRLDDRVSQYGVYPGNPDITVRELLTHTSEGIPGTWYQYNGSRFGMLGPVLEKITGMPFYALLMERIIMPLQMTASAPPIPLDQYYDYRKTNPAVTPFFDTAFFHATRPYELDNQGHIVKGQPFSFGAFGGLVTTVADLLKYGAAIDRHQFVSAATQAEIFTANRTSTGVITPYGLGWFVQPYRGDTFYWHYGQSSGQSALFIKVPARELTLVVLCNTDKLSQPFPLGDGDLLMSPVGQLFYRSFIRQDVDDLFRNKERIVQASIALLNGDSAKATKLYAAYQPPRTPGNPGVPQGKRIAALVDVGVNKELSSPFRLAHATTLRVYAVGEDCAGDGSFWCDAGWIEDRSGKVLWEMKGHTGVHAGGAAKNQKVDTLITLPAGEYTLHYRSDGGHAYNNWDSLPPDDLFWGIIVMPADK
ncbi:serine hydrolase domain-containing protein [Chitinophaga parva]|uniref:serine hydrolase domain-containing protein n=1 Tax=Chitinophaga parva TaxID=2169414 RepID=UPI00140344AC|nr:serine hydrolase domain-containing protein [Chitinophaga parva]